MTKAVATRLAEILRKQNPRVKTRIIEYKHRGSGVFGVRYGSRVTYEGAHMYHPFLNRENRYIEAMRQTARERRQRGTPAW